MTATGVPGGPAKAACDYVLADQLIHQFAGHQDDTLLAGVFSRMSPTYLEQYVSTLAAALPGSSFPASWAVHDYSGVTRGYLGTSLADLEAFDRELGTDTGGHAKDLWITEAGMLLNSRTKLGGCPGQRHRSGRHRGCVYQRQRRRPADGHQRVLLAAARRRLGPDHPSVLVRVGGRGQLGLGPARCRRRPALRVVRVLRLGDLHRQPRR